MMRHRQSMSRMPRSKIPESREIVEDAAEVLRLARDAAKKYQAICHACALQKNKIDEWIRSPWFEVKGKCADCKKPSPTREVEIKP